MSNLKLVEMRRDENGKQFMAFQDQTDKEAHEMNRQYIEDRDRMAAEVFRRAFENLKKK